MTDESGYRDAVENLLDEHLSNCKVVDNKGEPELSLYLFAFETN